MIKIEKKAVYYLRQNYHHESRTETKTFYDMEEAKKVFETLEPKYYLNKSDYSVIEEIKLYYKTDYGIKCYYKTIDPTNETIETNYKKEV